jgi:hypothetical protein
MSRNDTKPPGNFWALWVALFGWLAPMGVYYALRLQFGRDETWALVGPYLVVSFTVLAVFSQVAALFMAAMTWPKRGAMVAILIALALIALNGSMLVGGLRQMQ